MRGCLVMLVLAAALVRGQEPPAPESRPAESRPASEFREVVLGEEVDTALPGLEPLDANGSQTDMVTPILDEETGRPIAGAEARFVREPSCPMGDRWHVLRTARSDARGWLRMPVFEDNGWIFVLADGCTPRAEMVGDLGHEPFLMRRGHDVPVEVCDWWDRPIAGVAIEQLIGCGHTPNVRRAMTDAHGIAVMPGVDPDRDGDLWPVKEGYASEYGSIFGWKPGMPPVLIRMAPAPVIEGTVFAADGHPVPNVFVGASSPFHRGPWARTDSAGRFRLIGSTAQTLEVFEEFGLKPLGVVEGFERSGGPVTIRLAPESGPAIVERAAPASRPAAIRVLAKLVPRDLPEDARVYLANADQGDVEVTKEVARSEPHLITSREGLVVFVVSGPEERVIPVELPPGKDEVEIPVTWWDARTLRIRLLGPDGRAVTGMVYVRSARATEPHASDDDGAIAIAGAEPVEVSCRVRDRAFVYAWPDDPALLPARLGVDVRGAPPGVVNADVRLEPAAASRAVLMDPNGAPLADVSVTVISRELTCDARTGDDGVIAVPWQPMRRGTTILVPAREDRVAVRARLEGPAPWSVRLPSTALDLEARHSDGSALVGCWVLVDSQGFWATDGRAVLGGLAPGRHEIWVATRGFRPKRFDLDFAAGQVRRIAVTLRPER